MNECDMFWQNIVDDHRPRPRELLHSEAQLAATEATPLPRPQVETICGRAAAPLAALPAWRRHPKAAAAAAILVLTVAVSGWIRPQIIWPQTMASVLTTTYEQALANALQPDGDQLTRFNAGVAILQTRCLAAARALQTLAASAEPLLAHEAAAARAKLLALCVSGTAANEHREDPQPLIDAATDATRPLGDRLDTVAALPEALALALVAVRDAQFTDATTAQSARFMQDRIRRVLATSATK
jgi:hypothetical protein